MKPRIKRKGLFWLANYGTHGYILGVSFADLCWKMIQRHGWTQAQWDALAKRLSA